MVPNTTQDANDPKARAAQNQVRIFENDIETNLYRYLQLYHLIQDFI